MDYGVLRTSGGTAKAFLSKDVFYELLAKLDFSESHMMSNGKNVVKWVSLDNFKLTPYPGFHIMIYKDDYLQLI